jgi:putative aminopeptidase FrvX
MSSWELTKKLVLIPGVSGYEGAVADFIQSNFPPTVKPQRDDMDNVWFTVGEGRPHLLFVAHTDELGMVIENITPEGILKVRGRGGFISTMYEGRPVVIYTKKGSVNGVVAPRLDYDKREATSTPFRTRDFEIYVGVSSEEEVRSLGIEEGDSITIKKRIIELSPDLIATRAVDDRAGCAALLAAALDIDWNKIKGKTITFAWDVQEETGLIGASRLAQTLKPEYVFPVDTFVSSDGPLDSWERELYSVRLTAATLLPGSNWIKSLKSLRTTTFPFNWEIQGAETMALSSSREEQLIFRFPGLECIPTRSSKRSIALTWKI